MKEIDAHSGQAWFIHKYELPLHGHAVLKLPYTAVSLHVDEQDGVLRLWVACDRNAHTIDASIHVLMTGEALPSPRTYRHLGSVLVGEGTYAAHVFAALRP